MRWQSRSVVPLNAMCSTKWLMPFRRRLSWQLPVRTNTLTLTLSRYGMRTTTTRTPLPSVATDVSAAPASTAIQGWPDACRARTLAAT